MKLLICNFYDWGSCIQAALKVQLEVDLMV